MTSWPPSWNYDVKKSIPSRSIDRPILLEEQSCWTSSRIDLKRRNLGLFERVAPTVQRDQQQQWVVVWDQFLILKNTLSGGFWTPKLPTFVYDTVIETGGVMPLSNLRLLLQCKTLICTEVELEALCMCLAVACRGLYKIIIHLLQSYDTGSS